MKFNARAEMENIRKRIGISPSLGQIAARISLIVQFDQTAENQAVSSLGGPVDTNPRIEVSWHGLDQEINDAGFGVCGVRAG